MFLRENLFEPLDMADTGFFVPGDKLSRSAAMYGSGIVAEPDMTVSKWYGDAAEGVNRLLSGPTGGFESAPHNMCKGGHGLVSTVADYSRFCQMLLNKSELDGKRILSRKTVELMTANHLTAELMPYEIGGQYTSGCGYGLGFRVLMDVGQSLTMGSEGEYGWAGAAGTYFWIDPKEELIGILMAQFRQAATIP